MPPEPTTAALASGLVAHPSLPHRVKLGPFHNPVRMLTNAAAAVGFAFGAVALWQRSGFDPGLRLSVTVFTGSVIGLFLVSATFHSMPWSRTWMKRVQRLDHSMIYVLIAASYVPICLVALPPEWGIPMLAVVATLGAIGIVLKLTAYQRLGWLGYALYPIMGWAAVVAAPALATHLTAGQLGLIVAGGLAYTIGFPVLLKRWPDPWPRSFGYHEVWHVFTIVAAALHFGAIASLVV